MEPGAWRLTNLEEKKAGAHEGDMMYVPPPNSTQSLLAANAPSYGAGAPWTDGAQSPVCCPYYPLHLSLAPRTQRPFASRRCTVPAACSMHTASAAQYARYDEIAPCKQFCISLRCHLWRQSLSTSQISIPKAQAYTELTHPAHSPTPHR
jgi:hypothetical protein